jgi:hypothetical protein
MGGPTSSPDGGAQFQSLHQGGMGTPPTSSPDGGVASSQGGGMGAPTSSPDGGAHFHSLHHHGNMGGPTASPDATMAAQIPSPDATMAAQIPSPDATMAAPASSPDATMAQHLPGDHQNAFASSHDAGQPGAGDDQLAYSQASEYDILPVDTDGFDDYGNDFHDDEFEDEFDEDDPAGTEGRPQLRRLLISNAVIGFAVLVGRRGCGHRPPDRVLTAGFRPPERSAGQVHAAVADGAAGSSAAAAA